MQGVDVGAALSGAVQIDDDGGDVADVEVDGEAEERELDHRDQQREHERGGIAPQVQQLFGATR